MCVPLLLPYCAVDADVEREKVSKKRTYRLRHHPHDGRRYIRFVITIDQLKLRDWADHKAKREREREIGVVIVYPKVESGLVH